MMVMHLCSPKISKTSQNNRNLFFSFNQLKCGQLWRLQVTFSGVILEVCMRKLVFYPEVVAFIEEEKDEFPYVKVQYAYASPPKLIMLDGEGNQKEIIRSVGRMLFLSCVHSIFNIFWEVVLDFYGSIYLVHDGNGLISLYNISRW